jgi:2-C-methyl-D-erythritol 4-phosphate cytidylyltransferase
MQPSADALALARLAKSSRPLAIITEDAAGAQRILDEIRFFSPELRANLFPDWETLPYDNFSPHQDLISERLATLYQTSRDECDVLVVPVTTMLYRLPPPAYLAAYTFFLKRGERLAPDRLKEQLTLAGYSHVSQVVSPGDAWFGGVDWSSFESRLRVLKCGGPTRALSVRNALEALASDIDDEDWVLVHDAARPCLDAEALDRLIVGLADDEVGGLLATPVADTLKRADADRRAVATQSREGLWQAQTPQMFRRALLSRALQHADTATTDEAGAVEALGLRPKLVDGSPANLKVTYAQDFAMAEALLSMRSRGQG